MPFSEILSSTCACAPSFAACLRAQLTEWLPFSRLICCAESRKEKSLGSKVLRSFTQFIHETPLKRETFSTMLALRFAGRQALRRLAAHTRVTGQWRTLAAGSWPDHELLPMPALSPTMESGNIGEWHLKVRAC